MFGSRTSYSVKERAQFSYKESTFGLCQSGPIVLKTALEDFYTDLPSRVASHLPCKMAGQTNFFGPLGMKSSTGYRLMLSKVEKLAKIKEIVHYFLCKNLSRFVGAIVLAEAESRPVVQPVSEL